MQQFKRQFLGAAVAALATVAGIGAAQAQAYPERDVTAVIQWGAGGGTDVAMRGYAPTPKRPWARRSCCRTSPARPA